MKYEYTRLPIGKDETTLNEYADEGWRVVTVIPKFWILERRKI